MPIALPRLSNPISTFKESAAEELAPCFQATQFNATAIASSAAVDKGKFANFKVYQSLDDLAELEPLWNNLVAEYPSASIFCTWEWLLSWWQSFGNRRRLLVLALFDSDSRLIGLAPLSILSEPVLGKLSLRVLRFVGDGSNDSDNLDFPVRPGFEEVFARKVVEYLREHGNEWDIVLLNTMPLESPVAKVLVTSLLQRPYWSCFHEFRRRLIVSLPLKWDDYVAQISAKERRNLAYYGRRLKNAYSVRIYRCTNEAELPACLGALFRLHQQRWQSAGQPGTFAEETRRHFYTELGLRLLRRSWLELWIAELNGKIAAVQFAMRYRDTVYSLQEGYDPDHASDRVGFILRAHVLKQLISEGVRIYDFLAGEDPHKARWKPSPSSYRDIRFAATWSLGGVLLNSSYRSLAAKEWLRERLHPSLWRLLHKANLALKPRKGPLFPGASTQHP